MNSLPWIGKITGCLGAELFIEQTGYKNTMYAVGVIQIIGVVSKSIKGCGPYSLDSFQLTLS